MIITPFRLVYYANMPKDTKFQPQQQGLSKFFSNFAHYKTGIKESNLG